MGGQAALARSFLVDTMLGKLAKWLRMLGFDAPCQPLTRPEDITACKREGRVAVTRNQRWCSCEGVLCLTANETAAQLRELVLKLEIQPREIDFLSRCGICNQRLERIPRNAVHGLVPDYVFETRLTFSRCSGCGKVYWCGSHPARMLERFRVLVKGTGLEGWVPGYERMKGK